VAVTYKASDQTRLIKDMSVTGSPAGTYENSLVWTHAVAEDDGVVAAETVCGIAVPGEVDRDFDTTYIGTRCARCANAIGLPHLGSR
jgi:hypothetical protein